MSYKGRLVTGMGMKDNMFKTSVLMKEGRTPPADMLPTKDMIIIEDVSPEGLPPATEEADACA